MKAIWYTAPSGDREFAPSVDVLLGYMRLGYNDYWGPYSPVGVLEWHEHRLRTVLARSRSTRTARQKLLFVRHPKHGWFFEYSSSHLQDHRWLVPLDQFKEKEQDSFIKHWACGEQLHFRKSCFIPQGIAEQVVTKFMIDGEPSPSVHWVEFNDILPRLAPDEYRKWRSGQRK